MVQVPKRYCLNKPEKFNEGKMNESIEEFLRYQRLPFTLSIERALILKKTQFAAFHQGTESGHFLRGFLRYDQQRLHVPYGKELPAFTYGGFKNKEKPVGIITIDEVIACPLSSLTNQEALSCGFESKDNMTYRMVERTDRPYKKMSYDSWITYYKISGFNPNPLPKNLQKILEIVKPFEE